MSFDGLWNLLHVVTTGFYAGGLLALLLAQSLLLRATDEAERRTLAQVAARIGRLAVVPLVTLGLVSGLAVWVGRYAFNGWGRLFACTPIYVHVMLGAGVLATGLAHAWAARTRRSAEAAERAAGAEEIRGHARKAFLFGGLSLLLALVAFTVAILKVPNPPLRRCSAAVTAIAAP